MVPKAHGLERLVEALRALPGVGPRSAQRMAYHLLQHDRGARTNALDVDHVRPVAQAHRDGHAFLLGECLHHRAGELADAEAREHREAERQDMRIEPVASAFRIA